MPTIDIDPPKILLVGPAPPFRGGIPRHTTELFRSLETMVDVTFHSFRRQYPQFLYPGTSDIDPGAKPLARVHYDLDYRKPWTWTRVGFQARRFDALVLPWWTQFWAPYYLLLVLCLLGSSTRLIFFCHNVQDHDAGFMARFLARLVLRRGDAFVVQSSEEKNRLEQMVGGRPAVRIVPHPPLDQFRTSEVARDFARKQLGLADADVVILFFGLIRPYKGLDLLLRAFARIAPDLPGARLLIVGENWIKGADFEQDAKQLGIGGQTIFRLEYLPDDEAALCLKASDFAVFPYVTGTGSAALQAVLGAGVPAIATRLETFREVEEDGFGLLVAPGDLQELAAALRTFAQEENRAPFQARLEASQDGRKGWDRLAENIVKLATAKGSV